MAKYLGKLILYQMIGKLPARTIGITSQRVIINRGIDFKKIRLPFPHPIELKPKRQMAHGY